MGGGGLNQSKRVNHVENTGLFISHLLGLFWFFPALKCCSSLVLLKRGGREGSGDVGGGGQWAKPFTSIFFFHCDILQREPSQLKRLLTPDFYWIFSDSVVFRFF